MLRGRLTSWWADAVFAAGLVLAAVSTVSGIVSLALAYQGDALDPNIASTLYGVMTYTPGMSTGAVFIMAAGVALNGRAAAFPAWLIQLSAAYAAFQVIECLTVYGNDGAFLAGQLINTIGLHVFLVWWIAIGVALSSKAWPSPPPRSETA
jgi:hypothetical protein